MSFPNETNEKRVNVIEKFFDCGSSYRSDKFTI